MESTLRSRPKAAKHHRSTKSIALLVLKVLKVLKMNSYVCDFFVLFRTYLFVRALYGGSLSSRHGKPGRTHWVEVRARPVPSGARGKPVLLFFSAGGDTTISLVSVREALFCTGKMSSAFCPFTSTQLRHVQGRHRQQAEGTTLQKLWRILAGNTVRV